MAAREVVLWCIGNPQELEEWGRIGREEDKRKKEEQQKRRGKKEKEKQERKNCESSRLKGIDIDMSNEFDESEVLCWSDIAEDLGWPHPDTGYDPWSD